MRFLKPTNQFVVEIKILLIALAWSLIFVEVAQAQSAPACIGPADLCKQIEVLGAIPNEAAWAVKFSIAGAAVLRTALALLRSWKPFFASDRGKAIFRAVTLVVGVAVGLFSLIGLGMPWWEATILGAAGPGAIAVHELLKLVPAIEGKGPLPPDAQDVSVGEEKPVS